MGHVAKCTMCFDQYKEPHTLVRTTKLAAKKICCRRTPQYSVEVRCCRLSVVSTAERTYYYVRTYDDNESWQKLHDSLGMFFSLFDSYSLWRHTRQQQQQLRHRWVVATEDRLRCRVLFRGCVKFGESDSGLFDLFILWPLSRMKCISCSNSNC